MKKTFIPAIASALLMLFASCQKTAVNKEKGDGFVKAMWCGEEACEDEVKAKTGVGSRCIPLFEEQLSDVCVCCGKKAKHMVVWGKAY